MKRILINIVVLIAGLSGGWYAHVRFGNWPYSDLQWKFVEAVRSGDITEMERLYQKGARTGIGVYYPGAGEGGSPPILAAAEAGQPAAVKWLLDHGEDPSFGVSDTCPLYEAKARAREAEKTIEILKSHGATSPHK